MGALAFALSGPVGEAVRYRFLAEPVTVLLEVLFLWAAVAGAGLALLALLLVLGTWSKEFFVLFVPVILLVRGRERGWGTALRDTLLAVLPAILASLVLRRWWTPQLGSPYADLGVETLGVAMDRLRGSWPLWLGALPLYGLTPLAILGALRRSARLLWPVAAYVTAVALVPPFLNPVAFFPADVPRLLLYALPVLIPLALAALQGIWPPAQWTPPGAPEAPLRHAAVAWAAVAVVSAAPLLLVDRYRRIDLAGPRDGPYVLALCRESWRAARRLERGDAVVLDPAGFTWDPASRADVGRMRWFLREGWGPHAHYGTGEAVMEGARASVVLPVLAPRDVRVHVELDPPASGLVLEVNGRPVPRVGAGGDVVVPAGQLVRGDNVITLAGAPGARLRALSYHP